jgi:hypothetical protein
MQNPRLWHNKLLIDYSAQLKERPINRYCSLPTLSFAGQYLQKCKILSSYLLLKNFCLVCEFMDTYYIN